MAARQADVSVRYLTSFVDRGLKAGIASVKDFSKVSKQASAQVDASLRASSKAWMDTARIARTADRQVADQVMKSQVQVSRSLEQTVLGLRKAGVSYKDAAAAARGWGVSARETAAVVEKASAREAAAIDRTIAAQDRLRKMVGLGAARGRGVAGGAETRGIERGVAQAALGGVHHGAAFLGGGILGAAAGYMSVQGIKNAAENTTQLVKQATILSHYTGMANQTALEWGAVAQAYGISSRQLGMGFKTLGTQMNTELTNPSKKAKSALAELGISHVQVVAHAHDLNGMLGLVADKLNKLPPGAERTAVASKLLGRNWQALAPLLMQGSKGMQEQLDTAKALGVQMGGDSARNALKLHEAMIKLKVAQLGMQVQFTEHILPALLKFVEAGMKVYAFVRTSLAPVFHVLGGAVHAATGFLHEHKTVLKAVEIGLGALAAGFVGLKVISMVVRFVRGLSNDFRALGGVMKAPLSLFKAQESESVGLARSQTVLAEANARLAGSFDAVAVSAKAAAGGEVLARDASLGGGRAGLGGGGAAKTAERDAAALATGKKGLVGAAAGEKVAQAAATRATSGGLLTALFGKIGLTSLTTKLGMAAPAAGAVAGETAAVAGAGKGLLSRLGPGLAIGMGGGLAAHAIGGLVGGSAGKAIGRIGAGAAMGAGIGMVAGPVGAAVGGVVGGGIGALKSVPGALKTVEKAVSSVGQFISKNLGISSKDLASLGRAFQTVGKAIMTVINSVIMPVVRTMASAFKQAFGGIIAVVGGFVKILAGIFSGNFSKIWDGVKQVFGGFVNSIVGAVKLLTAPFRAFASWIGGAFLTIVNGAWKLIQTAFSAAVNVIAAVVGTVVDVIETPFRLAWAGVKVVFRAAQEMASADIQAVVSVITGVWNVITHTIPDAVSSAFNAVVSFLRGAVGTVASAAKSVFDGFVGVFSGIGSTIGDIFKSVINGVIDVINSGIDLINSVITSIPNIPGTSIGQPTAIGHIGHLAVGGYVPGDPSRDGTLALMAGNEFVLTGHGQNMMHAAAPGLLEHIESAQLPHFASGGHASRARTHSAPAALPVTWVRTGATWDIASGYGYDEATFAQHQGGGASNYHAGMSFAELLEAGNNAGMRPDLTQLLGLNRGSYGMSYGSEILVRMPGGSRIAKATKSDVGSGQAGNPHFTIDLHQALAGAIGWPPGSNQDVEVASTRGGSGKGLTAGVGSGLTGAGAGSITTTTYVPVGKGLSDGFDKGYNFGLDPTASGVTSPGSAYMQALLGASLKAKRTTTKVGALPASAAAARAAGGTAGGGALGRMVAEAGQIASHNYNYEWGGGHGTIGVASPSICGPCHGSGPGIGFDCSGAVSAVLGAGGQLSSPLGSGNLMSWGAGGEGKNVTVYASDAHTFMKLNGRYFGTSGGNPGGGANWIPSFPESMPAVRHPPGFRAGGRLDASKRFPGMSAKEVRRQRVNPMAILPGLRRGGHVPKFAAGGHAAPRGHVPHIHPRIAGHTPRSHSRTPTLHVGHSGRAPAPFYDAPPSNVDYATNPAVAYKTLSTVSQILREIPVIAAAQIIDGTRDLATTVIKGLHGVRPSGRLSGHAIGRLEHTLRNVDVMTAAHLEATQDRITAEIHRVGFVAHHHRVASHHRAMVHGHEREVTTHVERTTFTPRRNVSAHMRHTLRALRHARRLVDAQLGNTSKLDAGLKEIASSPVDSKVAAGFRKLQSAISNTRLASYRALVGTADQVQDEIDKLGRVAHHHKQTLHIPKFAINPYTGHRYRVGTRTIHRTLTTYTHHPLDRNQQNEKRRLENALQLVDYQMGLRVGTVVRIAEDQANALQGAQTRLGRLMTRRGIDQASAQGTAMLAKFEDQAVKVMRSTVSRLEWAYKAAKKAGDSKALADIGGKLASALDTLDQTITDRVVAHRNAIEAIAQDAVTRATHSESLAGTGEQALQLRQQLAGTAGTPGGGAQLAAYIRSSVVPALGGELAALQKQQQAARSVGDTALALQIAEAIATKQNDILQAQLDAQTAIKDATQQTAANTQPLAGQLGVTYQGAVSADLGGLLNGA